MRKKDKIKLVTAACAAREFAVAPHSKFKVGAALLADNGEVIPGANVESASYGLTCCAERVALFKALTAGVRGFKAIAVVARKEGGAMPCGACRQLLAEYAPDALVLVADAAQVDKFKTHRLSRLLPEAFTALPQAKNLPDCMGSK